MEVPVLNRITELGADLSSLPNPNFLSRIFTSFSPFQQFWKWGALIIALLATFTGIINRVKILIILIRRRTRATSISEPFFRSLHGGKTVFLVPENLQSPLLPSSESDDENEGDWEPNEGSDFRVKGSCRFSGEFDCNCCSRLRWRDCKGAGHSFSWPCFGSDRSVVRQWSDVKLKCEFEKLSGSVISLYDENEEAEICSFVSGGAPVQAAALSQGRMVVAASEGVSANVSLKLWDTRTRRRTPVVAAEWDSPSGKVVDVYYEDVDNVYLRDNGAAGIMVGDVRKVSSASENSAASGGDGWWESVH